MEGIDFVHEKYLQIASGCYLPRSDLLGKISNRLHEIVFERRELKDYIPRLIDVDLYVTWDGDRFLLFVSTNRRGHLPARGMEMQRLPKMREAHGDIFEKLGLFNDLSENANLKLVFDQLGFEHGFIGSGEYPAETYSDEAHAAKQICADRMARLIAEWANRRRLAVEHSRIFLSHRGVNKPLIDRVDYALRMLNLKTWFDRDDLAAGDTLVRGVDSAFEQCSAAVFFISGGYEDAGVIAKEIYRASHEAATRKDGFRIIPLVLAQHGGSDERVPALLKTLVWKTVQDIEIVPHILRALPQHVQDLIRYAPPK